MNTAKAPQSRTPLHPGRFVRTKIIEPHGLSVKDAATALGVHRVALSRLLNEQAALSAEMAVRLEKAFGADMVSLMRMQSEYDIRQAKLKFGGIKVPGNVDGEGRNGGPGRAAHSRISKDSRRSSVAYTESGSRKSGGRG
ncbi:MAG: addiction module antidote protein, HigA family [Mesorhizobium sp.]|nr:MAG: addiction module antidote protein, HigA family [Mesorhizobium sp.]RWD28653.1 MAG: addiction module antidote protein, HigA family [Mesorhizobium sp.]RWE98571.1 MAG: addiction module antidote protein, HigA family [Mesorhizobium sp.]